MSSGKISSLGAAQAKETIYIDVDEEITALIDRVTSSKAKIVALVLPKRATVMQSIVNMKLLKHTAETAGKNVVLVTSESSLMPLAGMVGLHVAATPTSKPIIPDAPTAGSDEPDQVDEPLEVVDGTAADEPEAEFDPKAAAVVPVGMLAAQEPEAILMADDDAADSGVSASDADTEAADKKAAPKVDKKLKVPSFNKFRLGIVLGIIALIVLVVGWIVATKVLPKAGVAITTDSSTINSELSLTLDTSVSTVDTEAGIVPATAQTASKTYSQEVSTTGQVNNGKKATGSVVFSATQCVDLTAPDPIAVGSSVKSNSHTYITQEKGVYTISSLTSDHKCLVYKTNAVDIQALKGGTDYNLEDDSKFTGAGIGTGSASGGTDDIAKVVSQTDIDSAKSKISSEDTSSVKEDLSNQLSAKGLMAVDSTFIAGDQQVTTSANVGDAADTVKVTATVPYTMFGIKKDDLKAVLMKALADKVDTKKQTISSDGLDDAKFSQQNSGSATSAAVLAKIKTVIGPKLDADAIRKQVVGLKSGEITDLLEQTPGVTDVKVAYSPFWVSSAPSNTKKITIIIDGETK